MSKIMLLNGKYVDSFQKTVDVMNILFINGTVSGTGYLPDDDDDTTAYDIKNTYIFPFIPTEKELKHIETTIEKYETDGKIEKLKPFFNTLYKNMNKPKKGVALLNKPTISVYKKATNTIILKMETGIIINKTEELEKYLE